MKKLEVIAGGAPVRGLDARYFTDRELFAQILEQVFYRNWLLACHASQVAKPGDYLTLTLYDQDILIARGEDGALNAFYNVCQHRGHPLARGSGHKKLLVCPYHRWSYDLAGRLRAAPNAKSVAGFDMDSICLTPVRAEDFLGFVFINLDPDAMPMDQVYPGVREAMLELCPDLTARKYAHHHEADEGCNWLTAVENYNECYHCKACHASFAKGIIDPESYRINPFGDIKVLHHRSHATRSADAWYDVSGADYGSFYLWPASAIQFYPGGVVNSYHWHPLAVDDVRVYRTFYSNDGAVDATLQKVIDNDRATTFSEDLDLVRNVQRGLKSRGYRPGPLVVDPEGSIDSELPIQKLHEWLREAVG